MTTNTQLTTADDLIRLPRGRYRYELVKGELLTMSPSGAEHGITVVRVTVRLGLYVELNKLGLVFGAETGFKLESNPDTVLAPDISFIRSDRIHTISPGYLEIAPDLAVEVISPSETKRNVESKTAKWLEYGTLAVWLVYPEMRTVDVRRISETQLLAENDELNGDHVVPGFRIRVSEIFC